MITDRTAPSASTRSRPTSDTDRARGLAGLMVRIQAGDREAFRDLYDDTIAIAHATAWRTTASPEHASEVAQEVFLHLWQHAADYSPARGSVLSWLLMLVHRRAVDRVRQVTSAARRDQRDFHRTGTTSPDVADLAIARHDARQLHDAFAQLSTKHRDAVTLTYLHGCTTREAASLLEIPVGTVKTRVRDGIIALRHHLTAQAA